MLSPNFCGPEGIWTISKLIFIQAHMESESVTKIKILSCNKLSSVLGEKLNSLIFNRY